jgi:hypothetical protein
MLFPSYVRIERVTDAPHQPRFIRGLLEKIERAPFERLSACVHIAIGRQKDNWQGHAIRGKRPLHFQTGHLRQMQIKHHAARPQGVELFQKQSAGVEDGHFQAGYAQQRLHATQRSRIVIHGVYNGSFVHGCGRTYEVLSDTLNAAIDPRRMPIGSPGQAGRCTRARGVWMRDARIVTSLTSPGNNARFKSAGVVERNGMSIDATQKKPASTSKR